MNARHFFRPPKNGCCPSVCFFGLCIVSLLCIIYAQLPVRIVPEARQSVNSICGTVKVKAVFLCKDSMWYVDFSETSPQIRKINKTASAHIPSISPDGQWITYQTDNVFEGPPTESVIPGKVWFRELAVEGNAVKVADTGYVPRFVQNTPAHAPEIIYSTSLDCPDNLCYNAGKTLKKRLLNKIPQPAQIVYGKGSYYGGLSWDNRYLCTGWPGSPNAFLLDLQNEAAGPRPVHSVRVKKTGTDIDTFVAVIACNISRSASVLFPDNMLYVDASSDAIKDAGCYHPLLGEWAIHERLFISRYDGEDLKVLGMPGDHPLVPVEIAEGNGEPIGAAWEFPEWSNHPYFAISSLMVDRVFAYNDNWEHTYNCEAIYLIDLKDSTFIRLLESIDTSFTTSTNLIYPFLWVEKTPDFREDATWLEKTIWQNSSQGVVPYRKGRPGTSSGQSFFSDDPGAAVTVYSMLGRKIGTMNQSDYGRNCRKKTFPSRSSGVYLLRIDSKGCAGRTDRVIMEK